MKIFARGHKDVRTDGEFHVWPSKHDVLFLLHAFILSFFFCFNTRFLMDNDCTLFSFIHE